MYHLLHETDQVSKAGCVCCRRNWGQKLDNLSYSRVLTPHRFFQGDPSQLSKYLDNFILNFLKGLTLPSTFYFPRQCLVSKESWHDLKASGFGWFSCCLLLSLSKCWFSGVGTCSTDFGRTSVFVTCQGTFDFKGPNMFSSFVCHFSRTLCSLLGPGKQEWAELHAVLRTEIMGKGTCLDSLQWLSSGTLYLKDNPFCCNWWNFILFNGWVIILLKIYKHACMQIKYPCFTQDLGPLYPSSHWL